MTGREIRKKFLDFFEGKHHRILPSASLIPSDPTVLLTLAGMLQFKPYFLGIQKSPYPRLATIQKCVRMNDIERVGKTKRHHTFFEMLGNFSFGDYFKKEAIVFAWEFLTDILKLQKEKLYFAVYEKDRESHDVWKNDIKISDNKISLLGKENNFWSAGPTGPCGPCSEIYYDIGEEFGCNNPSCGPGCDCDRFLEIWNLVFIEFNRNEDGTLSPLPAKNIDTGMGLERIASVLQGVSSNFETDLFTPIISEVRKLCSNPDDEALRVIADHARAASYMIADGIVPSNEGRGYVLRRIIRRSITYGKKLNIHKPFLYKLSNIVINIGKEFYPELLKQNSIIEKYILIEEEQFGRTLEEGVALLKKLTSRKTSKTISGTEAFKLYDTFGFPIELTKEIAQEDDFSVDVSGFERELDSQRNKSRSVGDFIKTSSNLNSVKYQPTQFIGYETMRSAAIILDIIDSNILILDKTPFYAESGGQVTDIGHIEYGDQKFNIVMIRKNSSDVYFHQVCGDISRLTKGLEIYAVVDEGERKEIARHHTATHLLHKALKEVLGLHVNQAGSYVGSEKLRFDFNHFSGLKPEELERVEEIVNKKIKEDFPVKIYKMSLEEAKKIGATALFGEKYDQVVRLIEIGNFSMELCGGTHVTNTGELKFFKITEQSSVASGIRRIEAVAGTRAEKYCLELGGNIIREAVNSHDIGATNKILSDIAEKKLKEQEQIKQIEKQKEKDRILSTKQEYEKSLDKFLSESKPLRIGCLNLIFLETDKDPAILADVLSQRLKSNYILVLWNAKTLVVKSSGEVDSNSLIKFITGKAGGGGGGRPSFAKAGGFSLSKLADLKNEIADQIKGVA